MNKRLYSGAGLVLLAVAFIVFTLMNNALFSSARLDLTENRLFTLSEGSKRIIRQIDEPVNLYFFFSQKASEDLTALRAYAVRVRELLEQYAAESDGKIRLTVVDPEPFTDREDQAAGFGLQAIPLDGDADLYFGLAGTNALDDQAVIGFFQPDKEEFLEYEISKLIQGLSKPARPVVGLMSSLKMQGDVDMQTFQPSQSWVIADQLDQLFEVKSIEMTATEIPADIELLVLVHPKVISDETRYAIDQFAMAGGRILVFVDPHSEIDRPAQANPMMPSMGNQSSDLKQLFDRWGVSLSGGKMVGDAQLALQVSAGSTGRPVRHFAILGLSPDNLSSDDVITSSLENINVSSAGILDVKDDATTSVTPLVTSSEYAMPLETMQLQFMGSPEELQQGFSPTGERYAIAVRIQGSASSAFDAPPDGVQGEHLDRTDSLNVIAVADTDMLADRMWVQVQSFFGQRIASPWANNGDFVINAVDNLVGSADLISVRSRGRFSRPFTVVQDLRREAEERYLASANDLQARLSETERKLTELETERTENNLLTLSPEQEAALQQFQDEKLRIRKQLRDVRHQLDKDIESLGTTLKFFNILLLPLLMTLGVLMVNYVRARREGEP
jgi:ABC-type uncharacterized transport system involved in gliding motility auxiliary subunit